MSEKTIGQRIAALCESIDKYWKDMDSLDYRSLSMLRSLAAELDLPMDNGDGTVTTWAPVTVPKPIVADTPPQFEAGKWYRDTAGNIRGPLRRYERFRQICEWMDCEGVSYEPTGKGKRGAADLLPGEVTVWQPPVSLKAGEYVWTVGEWLHWDCGGHNKNLGKEWCVSMFSDWTDPPKPGRYKVPGGGKIATWEGA